MEISIAAVFIYYVFKAEAGYPTGLVCVYPSFFSMACTSMTFVGTSSTIRTLYSEANLSIVSKLCSSFLDIQIVSIAQKY